MRRRLKVWRRTSPLPGSTIKDLALPLALVHLLLPKLPAQTKGPPPQIQKLLPCRFQLQLFMGPWVQEMIGKILGGEAPAAGFPQPAPEPPAGTDQGAPFSIPKPKRGEKKCSVCQRAFWSTTSLRQHVKTHTGEQKHTCPNPGCGRKLSSKRSLETQMQTCQKEKTHFCKHKDCKKLFATEAGLKAHSLTHKTLSKKKSVCSGCGKGGFTKEKSLKDHFRYCDGNPEKVGPFPCLVPGCPRGPAKPFRHTRNLNVHMKEVHGFDPKYV